MLLRCLSTERVASLAAINIYVAARLAAINIYVAARLATRSIVKHLCSPM